MYNSLGDALGLVGVDVGSFESDSIGCVFLVWRCGMCNGSGDGGG